MNLETFVLDSSDPTYMYVGYVMKSSHVCYYHQALVERRTKQTVGLQSAISENGRGHILGTLKLKHVPASLTQEFWEVFQQGLTTHTDMETLKAEMPPALARHYLRHMPGMCLSSNEKGHLGLTVLTYKVEREMTQKTKYALGVILGIYLAGAAAVVVFGADPTAVFVAIPMPAALIVSTHFVAREISSAVAKIKGLEKSKS